MRLLLDECTPTRLTNYFPRHHIQTVTEVGLYGLKNGQLLRAAVEMGFDVLIRVDQRLRFQQNLSQFNLFRRNPRSKAVPLSSTKILVPKVLKALETIRPGDRVVVQRLSIVS